MADVTIGNITVGNERPLTLIAGPCAMEGRAHALEMADRLTSLADSLGFSLIYKSSFDKANRTSLDSPRGIGMAAGLDIFAEIKECFNCPVLTDVHTEAQCAEAAKVVDVLQIPAFLCRQTDLLVAGNDKVLVTERGASFGYNMLVSDMRALPVLKDLGQPVVFDATHSVQQPGGLGGASGGERRFVPVLARAALSIGVAALFLETHQDPDNAPSDGPNMVHLKDMPALLKMLRAFDQLAKDNPFSS